MAGSDRAVKPRTTAEPSSMACQRPTRSRLTLDQPDGRPLEGADVGRRRRSLWRDRSGWRDR